MAVEGLKQMHPMVAWRQAGICYFPANLGPHAWRYGVCANHGRGVSHGMCMSSAMPFGPSVISRDISSEDIDDPGACILNASVNS